LVATHKLAKQSKFLLLGLLSSALVLNLRQWLNNFFDLSLTKKKAEVVLSFFFTLSQELT